MSNLPKFLIVAILLMAVIGCASLNEAAQSAPTVVAGTGQAPTVATATAQAGQQGQPGPAGAPGAPGAPVAPPPPPAPAGGGQTGCSDGSIQAGGTAKVLAGCNVVGDIVINNVKMKPGDDPKTGTITTCSTDCVVTAPNGAGITGRSVAALESELLTKGCGSGCTKVVKNVWPPSTAGSTPLNGGGQSTVADCDPSIPTGGTMLVPAGCTVTGDISVGPSQNGPWRFLGTGKQDVGLAVHFTKDTWVLAAFGASATNASLDGAAAPMLAVGCGLPTGCRDVKKVTYP